MPSCARASSTSSSGLLENVDADGGGWWRLREGRGEDRSTQEGGGACAWAAGAAVDNVDLRGPGGVSTNRSPAPSKSARAGGSASKTALSRGVRVGEGFAFLSEGNLILPWQGKCPPNRAFGTWRRQGKSGSIRLLITSIPVEQGQDIIASHTNGHVITIQKPYDFSVDVRVFSNR